MKKFTKVICSLVVASMLFTACSSSSKNSDDETTEDVEVTEDEEVDEDDDETEPEDTEEETEETSEEETEPEESEEETEPEETTEAPTSVPNPDDTYFYNEEKYEGEIYIEPAPEYLHNYYSELDITSSMIVGTYSDEWSKLEDEPLTEFITTTQWTTLDELMGTNSFTTELSERDYSDVAKVSAFPCYFRSGGGYNLGLIDDYEFCEVWFRYSRDENIDLEEDFLPFVSVYAVIEVNNNQLTLKFLSEYSVNDNGTITYSFTGKEITYDISLSLGKINLSYNGSTITLENEYASYQGTTLWDDWSSWSVPIDDITEICIFSDDYYSEEYPHGLCTIYYNEGDSEKRADGIARLSDDGVLSFAYTDESGVTHTHHFILLDFGGTKGFALANEDGVSFFSAFYDEYYAKIKEEKGYVGINVLPEDNGKLDDLTEEDIDTLIQAKNDFFDDLEAAFNAEGIEVLIDRDSGVVTLDSSVLYDNNEYEINDDGKDLLDAFNRAVLSVLSDEKYDSFLSQILIQGHTDSNGTYEHNVELSNNRANGVMEYIQTSLADATDAASIYFSSILKAEGCASDHLIYNEDGTENHEASRRVEFIFYVNLDYVNQ